MVKANTSNSCTSQSLQILSYMSKVLADRLFITHKLKLRALGYHKHAEEVKQV